jgi:uncharacterized repeat protein (TIGR01451 family)
MTTSTSKPNAPLRLRYIPLAAVAALSLLPNTANAAITNDAKATGTYGATAVESATDSATVTVTPAGPAMTISQTISSPLTVANGPNNARTDALDTLTFNYIITNTGNVTMTGVVPNDPGPQFNGTAGTNTIPAFTPVTLAPGQSASFSGVYTLSAADARRGADITNGVTNVATITATPTAGVFTSPTSNTVQTQFTGYANLTMAKTRVLTDAAGGGTGTADVGETITYTYTVSNTGTAAVTNVSVNDLHEGAAVAVGAGGINGENITVVGTLASTDTTANNGVWSSLAAGATVQMTYTHVVTLAEFNNQ